MPQNVTSYSNSRQGELPGRQRRSGAACRGPRQRRQRSQLFPCRDSFALAFLLWRCFLGLDVVCIYYPLCSHAVLVSAPRHPRTSLCPLSRRPPPPAVPTAAPELDAHSLTRGLGGINTARIPACVCSCFQSHGGALRRQELRLQDLALGGRGSQGRQGRLDRPLRRSVPPARLQSRDPSPARHLFPDWKRVLTPLYPMLPGFGLCGTAGKLEITWPERGTM